MTLHGTADEKAMEEALIQSHEPQQRGLNVSSNIGNLDDEKTQEIPEHVITLFQQVESRSFGLVIVATITYLIGLFHAFALRSQPICISAPVPATGTTELIYPTACSSRSRYNAEDFSSVFYGMGLFLCGSLLLQLIPLIKHLYQDNEPVRGLTRALLPSPCRSSCSMQRLQIMRLRDSVSHDMKELCATISFQKSVSNNDEETIEEDFGPPDNTRILSTDNADETSSAGSISDDEELVPMLQIV